MKLLLASLLSIILVISTGSAYAYDGKMKIEVVDGNDENYGDVLTLQIHLYRGELIDNSSIIITAIEDGTKNIVKTDIIGSNELIPGLLNDEESWSAQYVIDTTDTAYKANTIYNVEFGYQDIVRVHDFMFNPPPAEQSIESGESFAKMDETEKLTKEIPSWVKEIAIAWGNGDITDEEFRNAIQYLIKIGIIAV
ncbi:hypothetical protein K0U27_00760 [archaeon]|nr:hypothetical protein [archaeon]